MPMQKQRLANRAAIVEKFGVRFQFAKLRSSFRRQAGEAGSNKEAVEMKSDEQAIREVHSSWIDAVNAGDLVCLLSLMSGDVVFLNPGRAPFGREEFPDGFTAGHQRNRIRCISEVEEVTVVGEVAYTVCHDSLSITPRAGGETKELSGHRITVYRKQPDGRWLLARDAHTLTPVTGNESPRRRTTER